MLSSRGFMPRNFVPKMFQAVLLSAGLLLGNVAFADYAEVNRLMRAGQYPEATVKADQFLAGKPKDPQMRFLKGVILTEQGKPQDAITQFTKLIEDYPELPEPYNNLAVLQAGQGQFDKARAALEMAIRTNPSYATAHENLGDVYAKLASQAYDRALQLDKGNSAVQGKLGLIRDLFSTQPKASQKPDPQKVASLATAAPTPAAAPAPTPSAVAVATKPEPAKAAEPTRVSSAPPPLVAPPLNSAPTTGPARAIPVTSGTGATVAAAPASVPIATPAAAPAPKVAATSAEAENVLAAVRGWAGAWSKQDADGYLAAYASSFKPDDGKSRREWEKERRDRVTSPSYVKVEVSDAAVIVNGDGTAEVKFRQGYDSNRLKNHSVRKTLSLVKNGSSWQIVRERNS